MKTETKPWNPAERLTTREAERAYLEAAFEDGDPRVIAAALGDVARARGGGAIAEAAGVSRETLYKGLQPNGNPTVSTLSNVLRALGYRLSIETASPEATPASRTEA
jgi:probable addiction module antidote protein